jgi:hypothetical protein
MPLEIPHILVNVDCFEAILLKLVQKAFYNLGELRELFLDDSFILLVLSLYMYKELLEMVRIIHD